MHISRRHLSYANVTATLALVFAMSGGALAANHYLINSTKQINPKVLKKLKGNAGKTGTTGATGAPGPQGPTGPAGAPNPNAINATNATNAVNATNATTASNALSLGGIPASGYTRSECNSLTGAIKGFAQVAASGTFSSSFTNVGFAYNCSGEAVQAKRTSEGEYEIKFLGNPAGIVVGSANQPGSDPNIDVVSFAPVGGGDWKVAIWNIPTSKFIDDQFQVILP